MRADADLLGLGLLLLTMLAGAIWSRAYGGVAGLVPVIILAAFVAARRGRL